MVVHSPHCNWKMHIVSYSDIHAIILAYDWLIRRTSTMRRQHPYPYADLFYNVIQLLASPKEGHFVFTSVCLFVCHITRKIYERIWVNFWRGSDLNPICFLIWWHFRGVGHGPRIMDWILVSCIFPNTVYIRFRTVATTLSIRWRGTYPIKRKRLDLASWMRYLMTIKTQAAAALTVHRLEYESKVIPTQTIRTCKKKHGEKQRRSSLSNLLQHVSLYRLLLSLQHTSTCLSHMHTRIPLFESYHFGS